MKNILFKKLLFLPIVILLVGCATTNNSALNALEQRFLKADRQEAFGWKIYMQEQEKLCPSFQKAKGITPKTALFAAECHDKLTRKYVLSVALSKPALSEQLSKIKKLAVSYSKNKITTEEAKNTIDRIWGIDYPTARQSYIVKELRKAQSVPSSVDFGAIANKFGKALMSGVIVAAAINQAQYQKQSQKTFTPIPIPTRTHTECFTSPSLNGPVVRCSSRSM